ncbi:MAG: GNAT family N-acetyltransferase [Pseudomonadota bacterium]|nr:GNAT family N-acetyltransferase [Pseudomonadota bacterium]
MTDISASILHSINDIEPDIWDQCANAAGTYNPFVRHKFLAALETSGSVSEATGWQPFHLQVEKGNENIGVVPMYLKSHSQGEYVFDYAWADAWHRAGGRYYPKLQVSVPFTPATGPRLLCDRNNTEHQQLLMQACQQVAQQTKVSSLHMTFMTESQWHLAGSQGLLRRMDQQFHWHNGDYSSFDDFLSELASKKRKNLRRERREALSNGIEIEWATGADLTPAHWDAFYTFYLDTGQRKWGSPYLNRAFFAEIHETMADDILLIMAKREGRYIAGALNFIGGDTLFGRNWGCIEDHRFLHFEVCYYQAIDFAIARGLRKVEAGAQGSHKVARGYLPQATHSAHWIADSGFRDAVARFVNEERDYVSQDMAYIDEHSPFNAQTNVQALRGDPPA